MKNSSKKASLKMNKADLLSRLNESYENIAELEAKLFKESETNLRLTKEIKTLTKENLELREKTDSMFKKIAELEDKKRSEDDKDFALDFKYKELASQHTELSLNYEEIRKLLLRNQDNFSELKRKFDRLLEVKKSYQKDKNECHFLIDYRYMIRFINKNASLALRSDEIYEFVDQKVFRLFDWDNGMVLKKGVDKILMGKKNTVTEGISFKLPTGRKQKYKAELYATNYENKPAVLFTIKQQ